MAVYGDMPLDGCMGYTMALFYVPPRKLRRLYRDCMLYVVESSAGCVLAVKFAREKAVKAVSWWSYVSRPYHGWLFVQKAV